MSNRNAGQSISYLSGLSVIFVMVNVVSNNGLALCLAKEELLGLFRNVSVVVDAFGLYLFTDESPTTVKCSGETFILCGSSISSTIGELNILFIDVGVGDFFSESVKSTSSLDQIPIS